MQAMFHAALVEIKDLAAAQFFEFPFVEPALDFISFEVFYEFFLV